MLAMKVTLAKPSRYYSSDVVSAYHDEDDFNGWACALGIGAGVLGGANRGMRFGAVLGPKGLTVGGIVGGIAGGITGALLFC